MDRKIAFFDVDDTLISPAFVNIAHPYIKEIINTNFFHSIKLVSLCLLHKMGILKYETILQFTARVFINKQKNIIDSIIEKTVEKIHLYYNKNIIDSLEFYKKSGWEIYLISALPEFVLEKIAKNMGVGGFIGTKMDLNSFVIQTPCVYGKGKTYWAQQKCFELNVPIENCIFYGDSISDLDLLKKCGKGILVNPGFFLKFAARKNRLGVCHV